MSYEAPKPDSLDDFEQKVALALQSTELSIPLRLRQRVIGSVRDGSRREQPSNRWAFAAAVAAGVFVWLHVSYYASLAAQSEFAAIQPKASVSVGNDGMWRIPWNPAS